MANPDLILSWFHTLVEAAANIAFALAGLLAGIRERLDGLAPGVALMLAAATATGTRAWALLSGYELPAGPAGDPGN